MKRQLYPAVLERGPKGAFGAWFPDFPGGVAGGRSQEQTIERAENALAQAVDGLFEHGRPLPPPTPIERIMLPKGCDFLAYFIVCVDAPERDPEKHALGLDPRVGTGFPSRQTRLRGDHAQQKDRAG